MMKDTDIKYILANRPVRCSECEGALFYHGSGRYICGTCGHIEYDDFGKVKAYVKEHGASSAIEIEAGTGVSLSKIELMLREGRLEIPEGSKYYIKCEKCGCAIRYGRLCPDCARTSSNNLQSALNVDGVGEKPKQSGKMRYYNTGSGNPFVEK
jgi:ribosomal protein S27AE